MTQAAREWTALDGKRRGLLTRCQKYAGLTLPILCTPDGYDENNEEMATDYQSLGAQAVNNLANKLMLALFAPSRPFFRLDIPDALKRQLAQAINTAAPGSVPDISTIENTLAVAEKNCVTNFEQTGSRPKLYEGIKQLIVTGNTLMIMPQTKNASEQSLRFLGIKHYVVKRNQHGRWITLIIKEEVCFDELSDEVQKYLSERYPQKYTVDQEQTETQAQRCRHYIVVEWNGKGYDTSQFVDDYELTDAKFRGKFNADNVPYRPLTWDLSDENNYGTGLVEQYSGDLTAISTMSEAILQAAILASEFRWVVNPGGMTSAQDFQDSNNGDAIPGVASDIVPLNAGQFQNLQGMQNINSDYINRIGKGFLLISSVIRDSERTTAMEVSQVANELETSLGGVYSRLSIDFQLPIAIWLIQREGVKVGGDNLMPTIVTGLDSLSRNGDLENIQACMQDMASVATLPPILLQQLKLTALLNAIFSARGLNPNDYVNSQDQAQAATQQDAATQAAVASAPGVAQEAMKQQGQQPPTQGQ